MEVNETASQLVYATRQAVMKALTTSKETRPLGVIVDAEAR